MAAITFQPVRFAKREASDAERIRQWVTEHPLTGLEYDWLTVDRHGHLAAFSTASYGPRPGKVNQRVADVDAAHDQVRARRRREDVASLGRAPRHKLLAPGDSRIHREHVQLLGRVACSVGRRRREVKYPGYVGLPGQRSRR